jgi:hypothetical protein
MNDEPVLDIIERIKRMMLAEFENVNAGDATLAFAMVMVWYVLKRMGIDGPPLTPSEVRAACHHAIDQMIEDAEQHGMFTQTWAQ